MSRVEATYLLHDAKGDLSKKAEDAAEENEYLKKALELWGM